MKFRTIASGRPLKLVVIGAGSMGRGWIDTVRRNPDCELAGIADINLDAARDAATGTGSPDLPAGTGAPELPVGTDGVELAQQVGADAVVDVTIPSQHYPVTVKALEAGLPVLGEKPVAATIAESLSLAATAERTGELFMVSQSRRYNPHVFALKDKISALGDTGIVNTQFYKAPRFGGFREEMDHVLLIDMAIHPFDTVRFLLDADPVSVTAEEFNPAWSWYRGSATASVSFTMTGGIKYLYQGSWCSPGFETSWNGQWRVSGSNGSALWDGDNDPAADVAGVDSGTAGNGAVSGTTVAEPASMYDSPNVSIAGSLAQFVSALRSGETPLGEVHENIMSLVMVEAAVRASTTDSRVYIDDVLDEAHRAAIEQESHPETREILASWTSVRGALAGLPQQARAREAPAG